MSAEPWPEGSRDWNRLHAYEVDGYPRPMIDTRYLRRACGTASQEDLVSIARDEATIPLLQGCAAFNPAAVQYVLDGLGVSSLEELHRLADAGREYEALTGNALVEIAEDVGTSDD